MAVMVRFDCGEEDRSVLFGPFQYAELCYDLLRVDDGHELATWNKAKDEWNLVDADAFEKHKPVALADVKIKQEDADRWWSDICIYSVEEKTI